MVVDRYFSRVHRGENDKDEKHEDREHQFRVSYDQEN